MNFDKNTVRPHLLKRSDQVAEQIKQWIMEHGLGPDQRLPQEKDLIDLFGVSRSTIREALKALESQGLVRMRTGPPGGAVVQQVPEGRAISLLGNYFYFQNLTLDQIYTMRQMLEPELAAQVAPILSTEQLRELETVTEICRKAPLNSTEEYAQRMAELDFHDLLANACENALLRFQCRFINTVLRQCTVYRELYSTPAVAESNPPRKEIHTLSDSGLHHHDKLLEALRNADADEARARMHHHMQDAWGHMQELEAVLEPLIVSEYSGATFLAPRSTPTPNKGE